MRSDTEPGGWQANSVAAWRYPWLTTQIASGATISTEWTTYT